MSDVPPPIIAPPEKPPHEEEAYETSPGEGQDGNKWKATGGGVVAVLLGILKLGKGALIALKSTKILWTALSMVASIWLYSLTFGWAFGIGFVLTLLLHMFGHALFGLRFGVPASLPLFIPGLGALNMGGRSTGNAFSEAFIAIGGPVVGLLSACAWWGMFALTNNPLYLALAYTAFLLNLFNMAPIYPLDGGTITACVTPYLLVFGYGALGFAALAGWIRNPLVYIIVLLSIPRVWQMLKKGTADQTDQVTTKRQRVGMGLAYVALAAILAWGAGHTHEHPALTPHQDRPSANQTV